MEVVTMSKPAQTGRSPTRLNYEFFTGPPEHEFLHSDYNCPVLNDLWGDMTPDAAIRAAVDEDDLDPCPRCVLQ